MPGFLISKGKKINHLKNYDDSRCIMGEIISCGWNIQWNVLDKFTEDNVFSENENYIIVFEGVILNKNELLHIHKYNDWKELLYYFIDHDKYFWKKLRGNFSGAIYDKKNKIWTVFTDQLGNHVVFYLENKDYTVFSSQLNYVTDWMHLNQIKINISDKWINDFLLYGYMLDTHTIIDGCKRVFPGCFIKYDENRLKMKEEVYYRVKKSDCGLDENQIIDELDYLFNNAIERIVKKSLENNYKVILDISGGLDSRMIVAAIKKLGYENDVLGINYAQDGSTDQIVSKTVSKVFNIEMLQFLMDGGRCIEDIDNLIFMNQGLNYYMSITGGKFVLENLDRNTYGVELWGILGDIYEGAMITDNDLAKLKWDYPRFRTSRLFPIKHKISYDRYYEDNEIMWFYIRGMLFGQNTAFIRQNYVEAPAVYGDIDFLDFIFSIPYEIRTKGHIYRKWMKKYYPDAFDIIYSDNKVKVCIDDNEEKLRILPHKIIDKIQSKFNKTQFEKTVSMNPIDYWMKNNESLSIYINGYFNTNIMILDSYPKLKEKIMLLFSSENSWDKIIAVSMISAIKQYI